MVVSGKVDMLSEIVGVQKIQEVGGLFAVAVVDVIVEVTKEKDRR